MLTRQANRDFAADNNVKRLTFLAGIKHYFARQKLALMQEGIDNLQFALGQITKQLSVGQPVNDLVLLTST